MEELKRKFDLVDNYNYEQLRMEQLNYIVKQSGSQSNPEVIRGMLLLINETDRWKQNFLSARKKMEE